MTDLELREKVATLVMELKVRVIKNDDSFHAGEWVRCYDGGSWCKDYLGDGGLVVDRENDMSREVPHYESDIAANERMVHKMIDDGWTLTEQRGQTMYECKWRRNGVERKGLIVGAIKHDAVLNVRATAALAAIEGSR